MPDFYAEIVDALTKDTRFDWGGSGAVLALYDGAKTRDEQQAIVQSFDRIVSDGKVEPYVVAQVIHIASCLHVPGLENSYETLRKNNERVATAPSVREAIDNYRAARGFDESVRRATGRVA